MDAPTFVSNCLALRRELLDAWTDPQGTSDIATRIRALALSEQQSAALRAIIDAALRDSMYTLLLALDGAASLGPDQQRFSILDEEGERIENLEAEAWRQFHGKD